MNTVFVLFWFVCVKVNCVCLLSTNWFIQVHPFYSKDKEFQDSTREVILWTSCSCVCVGLHWFAYILCFWIILLSFHVIMRCLKVFTFLLFVVCWTNKLIKVKRWIDVTLYPESFYDFKYVMMFVHCTKLIMWCIDVTWTCINIDHVIRTV